MAEKPTESRGEEAKSLVAEAAEAEREGDKAEAKFLMEAAKELDPEAAAEAAKPSGRQNP